MVFFGGGDGTATLVSFCLLLHCNAVNEVQEVHLGDATESERERETEGARAREQERTRDRERARARESLSGTILNEEAPICPHVSLYGIV